MESCALEGAKRRRSRREMAVGRAAVWLTELGQTDAVAKAAMEEERKPFDAHSVALG